MPIFWLSWPALHGGGAQGTKPQQHRDGERETFATRKPFRPENLAPPTTGEMVMMPKAYVIGELHGELGRESTDEEIAGMAAMRDRLRRLRRRAVSVWSGFPIGAMVGLD
jgi:hypothetical protein